MRATSVMEMERNGVRIEGNACECMRPCRPTHTQRFLDLVAYVGVHMFSCSTIGSHFSLNSYTDSSGLRCAVCTSGARAQACTLDTVNIDSRSFSADSIIVDMRLSATCVGGAAIMALLQCSRHSHTKHIHLQSFSQTRHVIDAKHTQ